MRLQLYEIQVMVGGLLAALMETLVLIQPSWLNASTVELLEGGSFLLCCSGIVMGGRAIRTAYGALGSEKVVAARDPGYMRTRMRFRIVSFVGITALSVLAARRFDFNLAYAFAGVVVLAVAIPLIDRASGWMPSRSDLR